MRWGGRHRVVAVVALLLLGGRAGAQGRTTASASDAQRAAPAAIDHARAADAELRIALFELLSGRPAAALARLDTSDAAAPMAGDREGVRRALAARTIAVQALAQLGLDEPLERTASALLADPAAGALAPALRARLAAQAYARGDDAAALRFASADGAADRDGVLALIAGLARMRAGAPGAARIELAAARRAGGPAAPYAAYADAIARLRADSAAAPAVLDSLAALAARAARDDGAVADRAGVTAAQIAYQLGRYDRAVKLAAAVRGDAARADALLVHGWALYRGGVAGEAVVPFDEYARRAPNHPASGEARAMAAQSLLVAGRIPDAGRRLRAIATAATAHAAALEQGRAALVRSVAQDVVARGVVDDLWSTGDGLAVRLDGAGAFDATMLTALLSDRAPPRGTGTRLTLAGHVRTDTARASALAARLLQTPGDPRRADAARQEVSRSMQRLARAGHAVAAARLRVEREVATQAAMLASAAAAQRALAADAQRLDAITRQLAASRTALARIGARARAAERGRQQPAPPDDAQAVRVLRDSAERTLARLQSSLTTLRARRAEASGEAQRLAASAGRGTALRQARAAADAAERERTAAASAVVDAVSRELDARVPLAVATLRRDAEAAEYAAAGAAFFAAGGGEVPRPAQVLRSRRASGAAAKP